MAEGRDDELRDLSSADARELQAFVEKRRWFEGKLKSLEEIPSLYPFLHPYLEASPSGDRYGFIRRGASNSEWQLPEPEQVKRWKQEREMIEEQVLDFDGGDLDRMKKKTRAATLLPLTPPSTHLVSITLDLIVVVDRLLALLIRRRKLLELTALRLQWDQARWQVALEARGLREEVDAIVRNKGRWTPVEDVTPCHPPAPLSHPETPMSRDPSSSSLPSLPSSGSLTHLSASSHDTTPPSTQPRRYPTPLRHLTPNRSLHIPLLHSQLVNLRIRHKNLVSTQLVRSGKLLDMMIDVAGGLKELGDTEGPVEWLKEGEKGGEDAGGAVPETLLDVQDELDAEVDHLGQMVAWCGELEQHYKLSEAHHTSSTQARHLATSLIERLHASVSQPPNRTEHLCLSNLLTESQHLLPRPIPPSFPAPSHPSYPENNAYNLRVVDVLKGAHAEAEAAIAKGREGVEWYARLVQARETLVERQADLGALDDQLRGASYLLEKGPDGGVRPDPDEQTVLQDPHLDDWIAAVPPRTTAIFQIVKRCTTACHHAVLANLQYRNLLKTPPRSLRSELSEKLALDDLVDDAEQARDNLLERTRTALLASNTAKEDSEIITSSRGIVLAAQGIVADAASVRQSVERAIRTSAWPSPTSPSGGGGDDASFAKMEECTKQFDRRIESHVGKPLAALNGMLKSYERRLPTLWSHLSAVAEELKDQQRQLCELLDLLVRVRRQARVVREVQGEAERVLREVRVLQEEVDRVRGEQSGEAGKPDHGERETDTERETERETERTVETVLARLGTLEVDNKGWEGKLAERVPLLAGEAGASVQTAEGTPTTVVAVEATADKPARLSPLTSSSVPPMTPPLSRSNTPQQAPRTQFPVICPPPLDMSALDASVRSTVNDLTLRVASSLSHCRSSCQSTIFDIRSSRCHASASSIEEAVAAGEATHERAQSRLAEAQVASKSSVSLPLAPVVAQDDVFGGGGARAPLPVASTPPRPSPALSDDLLERVQRVREELDGLQLQLIVDPGSAELQAAPALRRLPTDELTLSLKASLVDITAIVHSLSIPLDHPARPQFTNLQHALDGSTGALPRLDQLVAFNASAKVCDGTYSRLLEIIDGHQAGKDTLLLAMRDEANSAYERVLVMARGVEQDRRVSSEVKRLTIAREELQTLVEECLHPEARVEVDDSVSEMTRAESVMSMASTTSTVRPVSSVSTATRLPRLSGLSSSLPRSSSRSVSNPQGTPSRLSGLPLAVHAQTQSSRNRAVSDTPTGSRLDRVREGSGVGLPRPHASLGMSPVLRQIPGTPSRSVQAPGTETRVRKSSIPRPVRASTPSSQVVASPLVGARGATSLSLSQSVMSPRLRQSSRLLSLPKLPKREYVADPKNKLDVAVGKIVNKLSFDVPVRPVGPNVANAVSEWKDLSGQYWIGSEGKAKLCFCRILRSRTVMVRVGGGWVELSKFLLDHFAEMMTPLQPPLSPRSSLRRTHSSSTSLFDISLPMPLSSSSLASHSGLPPLPPLPSSHSNASIASSLGPQSGMKTPSRAPLALPETPKGHSSAERPPGRHPTLSPHTPGSVAGNMSFSSASPSSVGPGASPGGSPLVAFQFMRKAAESPKARENEKERYVEKFVGRRSTLGREGERDKGAGLS